MRMIRLTIPRTNKRIPFARNNKKQKRPRTVPYGDVGSIALYCGCKKPSDQLFDDLEEIKNSKNDTDQNIKLKKSTGKTCEQIDYRNMREDVDQNADDRADYEVDDDLDHQIDNTFIAE